MVVGREFEYEDQATGRRFLMRVVEVSLVTDDVVQVQATTVREI